MYYSRSRTTPQLIVILLIIVFCLNDSNDKLICTFEPDESLVIDADVIFVHGLGGDLQDSWTFKGDDNDVYFPDLLQSDKDLKYILRIWSFGYDNDFFAGKKDAMPLKQRGQNLLTHIWTSKLYDTEYKKTPIIFIVHSMGGLVVKEAILESFLSLNTPNEFWYNIYERIKGIIFYGTPHIGAHLANVLETITGGGDSNNFISYVTSFMGIKSGQAIKDLKFLDQSLIDLNIEFVNIINAREIQVLCLWETKPVPYIGKKIVDAGQCFGAYAQNMPLGHHHMDICKPEDHSDLRYAIARRYIKEFMKTNIKRTNKELKCQKIQTGTAQQCATGVSLGALIGHENDIKLKNEAAFDIEIIILNDNDVCRTDGNKCDGLWIKLNVQEEHIWTRLDGQTYVVLKARKRTRSDEDNNSKHKTDCVDPAANPAVSCPSPSNESSDKWHVYKGKNKKRHKPRRPPLQIKKLKEKEKELQFRITFTPSPKPQTPPQLEPQPPQTVRQSQAEPEPQPQPQAVRVKPPLIHKKLVMPNDVDDMKAPSKPPVPQCTAKEKEEVICNAEEASDEDDDCKLDARAPAYIPESWIKSPRWTSCGASASMDVSSVLSLLSKNTLPILPETDPNRAVQLIESSLSLQQIVNASQVQVQPQPFALPMNYAAPVPLIGRATSAVNMNYNNLYYPSAAHASTPTLSQSPTLLNVPQGAMLGVEPGLYWYHPQMDQSALLIPI
eukprot:420829_1